VAVDLRHNVSSCTSSDRSVSSLAFLAPRNHSPSRVFISISNDGIQIILAATAPAVLAKLMVTTPGPRFGADPPSGIRGGGAIGTPSPVGVLATLLCDGYRSDHQPARILAAMAVVCWVRRFRSLSMTLAGWCAAATD